MPTDLGNVFWGPHLTAEVNKTDPIKLHRNTDLSDPQALFFAVLWGSAVGIVTCGSRQWSAQIRRKRNRAEGDITLKIRKVKFWHFKAGKGQDFVSKHQHSANTKLRRKEIVVTFRRVRMAPELNPQIIGWVFFNTTSGARKGWRAKAGPAAGPGGRMSCRQMPQHGERVVWPHPLTREVPEGLAAAWSPSASLVAVCSGRWMRDDSSPTVIEGIIADGILRKSRKEWGTRGLCYYQSPIVKFMQSVYSQLARIHRWWEALGVKWCLC